jgi:sterol desaturase/sphingolipid hydroxylase (fatty acid hydroxylase superfamily)
MLGIPVGLLVANAAEWVMHKYVLHGLGKNRKSFWSFHWHEHHKASRKNGHFDQAYEQGIRTWNGQSKEALALLGAGLAVAPLLPVAPFFVGTLWYSSWDYYRKHKRAHLDPAWARENLPWHYDHHMGPNQHANWCVTRPWFDNWMGTRIPFVGTEREAQQYAMLNKRKVKIGEKSEKQVAAPSFAARA